jgi:hypothetical protein
MSTNRPNTEPGTAGWPDLLFNEWQDTQYTLHMWTQIVGKVRLALAPMVNHWWQVALYLTSRGLTTSPMPYDTRTLQIDFDFIDHQLRITSSDGDVRSVALAPKSVADFYREVMAALTSLGMPVHIWTTPMEIPDPIPFEQDRTHASYDADYAHRFWQILAQTERVFGRFRSGFIGKVSPVNFYWGSFDLALTRFSGRPAPLHPSAPFIPDRVIQEAYSHEVSSCGFWPGGGPVPYPVFYAYAYPEPSGFREATMRPPEAHFDADLAEFVLPYDDVRRDASPDDCLLQFLESSYEAAANAANWDRAALERRW